MPKSYSSLYSLQEEPRARALTGISLSIIQSGLIANRDINDYLFAGVEIHEHLNQIGVMGWNFLRAASNSSLSVLSFLDPTYSGRKHVASNVSAILNKGVNERTMNHSLTAIDFLYCRVTLVQILVLSDWPSW